MDNFKAVYLNDPPKMVHRSTKRKFYQNRSKKHDG